MGLLDTDAEELKRNKNDQSSSGRKVNQSGLGALKGLSKYSNLTAKYRTTGKTDAPAAETNTNSSANASVEQNKESGNSKSVQSQGKVSADTLAENKDTQTEVRAKSVQDNQGAVPQAILNNSQGAPDQITVKSVQSPCDSHVTDDLEAIKDRPVNKSNQNIEQTHLDQDIKPKNTDSAVLTSVSAEGTILTSADLQATAVAAVDENNTKSVQSPCSPEDSIKGLDERTEDLKRSKGSKGVSFRFNEVRAKSVQDNGSSTVKEISKESVQDQGEVRAKSVQNNVTSEDGKNLDSTKSVQSPCDVGANSLSEKEAQSSEVSAKSVQDYLDFKVESLSDSIKSVQSQCINEADLNESSHPEVFNQKLMTDIEITKVSAKSVQQNSDSSKTASSAEADIQANEVSAKSVQINTHVLDENMSDATKSVQSPCELNETLGGADLIAKSIPAILEKTIGTEVSAKSVQQKNQRESFIEEKDSSKALIKPHGEDLNKEPILGVGPIESTVQANLTSNGKPEQFVAELDLEDTKTKSVQSPCKVSANCDQIIPERAEPSIEVSAKSVQELFKDFGLGGINLDGPKASKVSAKSVQDFDGLNSDDLDNFPKSVQSPCKVGAIENVESATLDEKKYKVSAKSVQNLNDDFEASAPRLKNPDQNKVSAKSVQDFDGLNSDDKENFPKSVQSPGKVSAAAGYNVEHFPVSVEHSGQCKTKVLPKSLEISQPTESIISITGSQRVIVDFFFQLCMWNNSLITPPITKQQLTAETGLLEETALSSIKRLRKKNIIDRYAYKDGKAGWTQYQFSDVSYKELLHIREVSAKSVQQKLPLEMIRPIQSSPLLDKKSAAPVQTSKAANTADSGWFKNLDFSKIYPIGPMVVNPAIRTMVQENLNAELVQDFINRFTSWTSTQGRITSPIGLFCDKLKELAKEGDSPVFSCMTEEERRMEAEFAANVEKAKAEMDLIIKSRSEAMEKAAESKFEKWFKTSSDTEKIKFAEPSSFAPLNSEAYKRILKAAYIEEMGS